LKRVYVSDYSLISISNVKKLLFREKAAIVSSLCNCGVDSIELPEITRPKEDYIIYKSISMNAGNTELILPVGQAGPKASYEAIQFCTNTCLQVSLPVSPMKMEYKMGLKEKALLNQITTRVREAAEYTDVEFNAEDATRSNIDFLITACKAAEEAGASRICLSDEWGECLTDEVADMVNALYSELSIPIWFKASDKMGMALANSIAAIDEGCTGIKAAVSGKYALIIDLFASFVGARGIDSEITCGLNPQTCHSISEKIRNNTIADSIETANAKATSASADASNKSDDIFLDSSSDLKDVKKACEKLGYDLSEEDVSKVNDALKRICEKKSSVGRIEFEAIISSSAQQVPSTYHLENFNVSTSNITTSMAHVTLTKNGESIEGIAAGDGPIDSAFKAIEAAIGYHYDLDDFQIQAITKGKESLGATIVKLRSESGKLYSGDGLSSDIVGAGIRAYINALNKIVYEEQ